MNKNKPQELRCYAVSLDKEHWCYYNALSKGQAKMNYIRQFDFDIKYTSVKCKLYGNGHPYTSEDFVRMANYRQIPFAYCGMAVKVGDWNGFIAGHNCSSNLDVLFVDGKYKGFTLNCHPQSEITYFDKKGNVIKSFNRGNKEL